MADGGAGLPSGVRPQHQGELGSCNDSLTGNYRAEASDRYRYTVIDRGSVIEVRPELELLPDGGHPSDDYVFRLERPDGSDPARPPWPTGTLTFLAQPEGAEGVGKTCKVALGARITSCARNGFVLASKHNGAINWETCTVEERPTWSEAPVVRR